ncbi:PP2C family protein-serine/threonine phosphatase, partial [Candidatus Dependentiae bacterium]|nr:PP2C family protein-serine/threonine phosphatase [Candidatus Dependentiae bacterium]
TLKETLDTIKRIGIILNSSFDLTELLSTIMNLSSDIMDAEASSLMLLDEKTNELVFSVTTGATTSKLKEIRVPVGQGIAGWVAANDKPLLVDDVSKDPRFFKKADEKSSFKTKSILCVPLKVKNKIIGVLQVLNKRNGRIFNNEDLTLFSVMAHMAALAIENARLIKAGIEKEKFEQEIKIAQTLQMSILPKKFEYFKNIELSGKSIPARIAGGDFFDCIKLNDEEMFLLIADVSGKGVGAASLTMVLLTFIRASISANPNNLDIKELLMKINSFMQHELTVDLFITIFALKYNVRTFELTYVNAGHNEPLICSAANKNISLLKSDGIVLGMLEDIELFEHKCFLEYGDLLFLYTDGATECINSDEEQYGEERLHNHIKKTFDLPAKEIRNSLIEDIKKFCGEREQFDDISLLILKNKGGI